MKKLFFIYLLFLSQLSSAQHLTSSVSVNTSRVYVGEPVEVTVSVFTSTWFTAGLDIQNIKVNGAFTVPFRSLSTSKNIKGKTYAGVHFFYNVFPYSEEDLEFPALTIEVETPDDGGYKGVKRKVKTKPKTIKVRPIPPGFKKSDWLVTPDLTVKDTWSGDLKNVKVGDVLERRIHRNAALTVSELIPPVEWDSIENVSYYPDRPFTQNNKTKISFSAERTDAMRYLFLEEGDVIIPEITLMWWNAARKKVYKRTLKEVLINVQPNPDLGMVTSIKDSLDAMEAQAQLVDETEEKKYLGLTLKELLKRIAYALSFLFVLYKLLHWIFIKKDLIGNLKKRRAIYRDSEYHYFKLFLFHQKFKSKNVALESFYAWLNKLDLKESTASYFAFAFGSEKLKDSIKQLEANIAKSEFESLKFDIPEIKKARLNYFSSIAPIKKRSVEGWINP